MTIQHSVKGKVKIEKFEAEFVNGEWVPIKLVDTIEHHNRITIDLVRRRMVGDTSGMADWVAHVSEGMFIGAATAFPEPGNNGFVSATVAVGDTYTAAVPGVSDAFHEFISTVNPGASTRNIRTIVLTSDSTSYDQYANTIVNLPTPCVQTSSEILQITYRLILDQSAVAALGVISNSASERLFQNLTATFGGGNYIPIFPSLFPFDSRVWGKGIPYKAGPTLGGRVLGTNANSQEIYYDSFSNSFATDSVPEGYWSARVVLRLGVNNISTSSEDPCGMPIKGAALGNQGWTTITDVSKGSLSSVQNIFGRIADTGAQDRKPYLDNNIIATSAADVNLIDKGDWVDFMPDSYFMPYLYRVKIVAGGNVGVSTYKLQRRKNPVRWVDNRVTWNAHGIPFMHFNLIGNTTEEEYSDITTADTRKHGQTVVHSRSWSDSSLRDWTNRNDLGNTRTIGNRYVYPEFYSWDYDGLTFMSLDEHNWINLDTNSAQSTPFTEILQVGSDGLDVYVADASQGLYKIERDFRDFDTTNWTITKLNPPGITNTNSCRGVYLKGGSYHGHPGKVVDINIIRGGSNYSVDDIITITGVNGTSAAAKVARVDADGAITAVAVTNQGSGYIEDHIQAYTTTGTGVGAVLEPIIGAGGNLWAIFNDTTDGVVYMAHMTHIVDDSTFLNFDNSNPYVITGNGTSFITQGFRAGQRLIVRHAEDAANEGTYTISAVTATTITVTEAITTNNTNDAQAQIIGEDWEIMRETITTTETVTFANATQDTITGTGTSFITQGFREGMKIVISGSGGGSNDGIYTLTDVTATVMTIAENEAFGNFVAESVTIAALTDFTITNYTSGSPGGTGFIGLIMDPDHADDRFAMLTPDTKQANDGTTLQGAAGFDWWSFANSTGTTAAGTTDRVRVAAHNNTNRGLSLEQFATHGIGPLTDSSVWVVAGLNYLEHSSYVWGSATRTGRGHNAIIGRYIPHRCKTNFDIGVLAAGGAGVAELKSNRTTADFTDSTYDSIIAQYTKSQSEPSLNDYNPYNYAGAYGALLEGDLGRGVYWGRCFNDTVCRGGYTYSGNSNGTIAGENSLPYGIWQDFGWDGTRWVLDNAGARTTHAQSSFTGTTLNINATTGAIVGGGTWTAGSWAADGFEAGDIITIANAENATNNGDYRIESLSGTTLTVTPDKLPATTNTDDTTATLVGDRAIIDGLALSFDDSGGTAPLVINEYYDCYVYDGIINDNATNGTITVYHPWMATAEGSDFESVTIPNSDVGAVVNEPLTMMRKSAGYGQADGPWFWPEEPGVWAIANKSTNTDEIAFSEQQIPENSDFTFRFKIAHSGNGSTGGWGRLDVGVAPYSLAADGNQYTDTSLDYNLRVIYDYTNNPTLDQYTIQIRNTGSGTVQHTENADRVVLVEGQTHTNYTGGAPNGSFIGGYESATDTHAALDVITMNDGTIVNVDAVDANGTITQFTVSTNSTKSSGNGEINAVSSSATLINFTTGTNVITRTAGGTDFITDGFKVGMKIQVDGATTEANDGAYTIAAVDNTTITTEENLNNSETGTSATIQHAIVQIASTGTGVNFALIPGTNNLQAADVANDEFALNRRGTTGNNLYWTLNGIEFYRHTGGPFNAQYNACATPNNNPNATLYDANLDHTIDRRYVKIGNGTTTGASDSNFRCLPALLAGSQQLRLYYNDGSGPVEFTYITDGRTAPADGEVTILPYSGVLWFNTAQAGNTLTGNWTMTLKINAS